MITGYSDLADLFGFWQRSGELAPVHDQLDQRLAAFFFADADRFVVFHAPVLIESQHLALVREGDLAGAGLDFGLPFIFRQLIGHVQIWGVGGSDEMRTHAEGVDGEAGGQPVIDRIFIHAAAHEDLDLLQAGLIQNFSDGQRL